MKYILILLLGICSVTKADVRTDNSQTAYVVGFTTASLYDIYWNWTDKYNQNLDMSIAGLLSQPRYESERSYLNSQKSKYVVGKIGMGLLGGVALSAYNASQYQRSLDWNDIVFGGVGGLTSVIIHF